MLKKDIVYLSGLNGLRAIAAISVLILHISLYSISLNFPLLDIDFDGVTLFFVISGFLITYLLLLEKEKTGDIHIKNFYIRRILRIWPIYYLFILVCLVVAFYNKEIADIFSSSLFYYLFFAANIPFIFHSGIFIIVHYWSIGVEEQFYLFWPWVVKLVRNKLLPVTIAIICILFLSKCAAWYFLGHDSILYRSISITRFHCMLIGAVGAMLYKNQNQLFLDILTNRWIQLLAWLFILVMFLNIIYFPAPILAEITAVISLVLIIGQVESRPFKIINLENGLFDFLGKISYGIYVIHPLVILLFSFLFKHLNMAIIPKTIIVYALDISATILLAYLSYEYYEKRFLKLKKRFTVVKSANSKFMK